jgi:hypothetical protein
MNDRGHFVAGAFLFYPVGQHSAEFGLSERGTLHVSGCFVRSELE